MMQLFMLYLPTVFHLLCELLFQGLLESPAPFIFFLMNIWNSFLQSSRHCMLDEACSKEMEVFGPWPGWQFDSKVEAAWQGKANLSVCPGLQGPRLFSTYLLCHWPSFHWVCWCFWAILVGHRMTGNLAFKQKEVLAVITISRAFYARQRRGWTDDSTMLWTIIGLYYR